MVAYGVVLKPDAAGVGLVAALDLATVLLIGRVLRTVRLQSISVGKQLVAASEVTLERPLAGVDPVVVLEVIRPVNKDFFLIFDWSQDNFSLTLSSLK